MGKQDRILLAIILSQFFCTSLWFAGNGVMEDLIKNFGLGQGALGNLTSAVQLGFILGTLVFALLTIADRFSPIRVFFISALLGSLCNLAILFSWNTEASLIGFRILVGFFLAGIYPVGMKIAADHFDKGLGRSLSLLVGALVLGTALPHFIKGFGVSFRWEFVIITTSGLAILGGLLMLAFVKNGPFRKRGSGLNIAAAFSSFRSKSFRSAALGYFGHMWELYAFWGFVPVIMGIYLNSNSQLQWNVSLYSFLVIAIGAISCYVIGSLSSRYGPEKPAFYSLLVSGICCLISPLAFSFPPFLFGVFLLIWGSFVITDSPLFSTLVAANSKPEVRGSALTIVNSIGFALTIPSIQLISYLLGRFEGELVFLALFPGPILGLIAFLPHIKAQK